MQLFIKVLISACVIGLCTYIGRKLPSLAGLIAVMPLTGLFVLIWLYSDLSGDSQKMVRYCEGALWGILPSIGFFLTAFLCFRRAMPLWLTLAASFVVWIGAALVHQLVLGK
ncbi:MAG: DUF3147 family protein [Phycisphaerales bacterium]